MSTKLPPIQPVSSPLLLALHGMPLLRLGFRPFYIGAALLAALIVPLWVAIFLGGISWLPTPPPLLWHAHEMLFGFAIAVIVGFLLTAGKAWTGLPTPRGPALGVLVLLWLAARIAALVAPYPVFAVLDLALLPTVGVIFLRLLLRSRNMRNVPLAVILLLLSAVNLVFHLSAGGVIGLAPMQSLYAGLALIMMIECVMAGRVVPAFTASATPGLQLTALPWLERATLAATAAGLILWVSGWQSGVTMAALALASTLNLYRQLRWQPLITRDRPILWILHLSYLWLPIGLALLALAQVGVVTVSAGVHALAVGTTGGLIIGMMTRTARGHTGRPLKVGAAEVLAYVLVMGAAVLRVLLPLLAPTLYVYALVAAAAAWSVAFLIYLGLYTQWLMSTRLDGKDG